MLTLIGHVFIYLIDIICLFMLFGFNYGFIKNGVESDSLFLTLFNNVIGILGMFFAGAIVITEFTMMGAGGIGFIMFLVYWGIADLINDLFERNINRLMDEEIN